MRSKAGVKLQTKQSIDFVTHQIVLGAGGSTGWHSHPGPVLVTVKSGSLRLVYADDETCEGRIYLDPARASSTAETTGCTTR